MQTWLANQYLNSGFHFPGFIQQGIVNWYVELYHRWGVLLTGESSAVHSRGNHCKKIADHSAELMAVHYDMPRALFENFLGPTMKYSMGLWENGVRTLEESQRAMLDDLCRKAGIEDGQTILDIGCGFGSFALHALKQFPHSRVHGLTLSKVQAAFIREKQAESGHPFTSDRFHLIEGDFNDVKLGRRFDRVVSIGVFEHVSNLELALRRVAELLTPQGRCLLHYIVYFPPLDRMTIRHQENNFIFNMIFPGGRTWFCDELFQHQQHLEIVDHWNLFGRNYRRTLECWIENFERNRAEIEAIPGMKEKTIKLWELYLRVCVAVFSSGRGRFYGNGQYLLAQQKAP